MDLVDELSKIFSLALNKLIEEINFNDEKINSIEEVNKLMNKWNDVLDKYEDDVDGLDNR